jgi:regulator of replication initiation timing
LCTLSAFSQSKKDQIKALSHSVDSLSTVLTTTRDNSIKKVGVLNTTIDSLNTVLSTTRDNASKDIDGLNKIIDGLNSEIAQLKSDVSGLESSTTKLTKDNEMLKLDLEELSKKNLELEAKLKSVEKTNEESAAITEDTNQKSTAIVEDIVNDDNTEYYIIEDPDGYSNLREVPGGNVIRKVYSSEKFEIIGEENKYKKVQFPDGSTGYIHNSRVVKFNDKICECLQAADKIIKKDLDKDFTLGSKTGFPDNVNRTYEERLVKIFQYQSPTGCDFLADPSWIGIDIQSEIQRCSE